MASDAWKALERAVARQLGGRRTSYLGLGGMPMPDVETEVYSVECKCRKRLPEWITGALAQAHRLATQGKLPLVVLHEMGTRHGEDIVCLRLEDFVEWFGDLPGKGDIG